MAVSLERQRGIASQTVTKCLDEAENLTPKLREQYQKAAEAVFGGMGPKAIEAWNRNVARIVFYPSVSSADTASKKLGSRQPGPHPAFAYIGGGKVELHLNGGTENDPQALRKTAEYYAHEFAHAVDLGGELSKSQEWDSAWRKDGKEICSVMGLPEETGPSEGFAHFAATAWNYPEATKRQFPACRQTWSQWGLA
jgi:hypothetical protein